MKKTYTSPELELIRFEVEDIITESGVIAERAGDNEFTAPAGWWS